MTAARPTVTPSPAEPDPDVSGETLSRTSAAMQELVRKAKLQADELSLLIQRLEQLGREIDQHLRAPRGT